MFLFVGAVAHGRYPDSLLVCLETTHTGEHPLRVSVAGDGRTSSKMDSQMKVVHTHVAVIAALGALTAQTSVSDVLPP